MRASDLDHAKANLAIADYADRFSLLAGNALFAAITERCHDLASEFQYPVQKNGKYCVLLNDQSVDGELLICIDPSQTRTLYSG